MFSNDYSCRKLMALRRITQLRLNNYFEFHRFRPVYHGLLVAQILSRCIGRTRSGLKCYNCSNMRVFAYGEPMPQFLEWPNQEPITFQAVPYYTTDKQRNGLSLADEMSANKDKFPLVEDIELIFRDARQSPVGAMPCDIVLNFIDRATNQYITYWDMHAIDKHGPDNTSPLPETGKVRDEIEMGYFIVIAADDRFMYIAFTEEESGWGSQSPILPTYERYCKIPKDRFEKEWKEFAINLVPPSEKYIREFASGVQLHHGPDAASGYHRARRSRNI